MGLIGMVCSYKCENAWTPKGLITLHLADINSVKSLKCEKVHHMKHIQFMQKICMSVTPALLSKDKKLQANSHKLTSKMEILFD